MKRLVCLLLLCLLLISVLPAAAQEAPCNNWYEVFVRSYRDSDGDGLGDLNGLTEERFLEKIAAVAAVEKKDGPVRPQRKGQTGMYLPSGWYLLTFRQEVMSSDPVEGLDVSVLQKEILGPVLGIGDPRVDHRIDFVGGIRGLQELERRVMEDCAVAFSMFPTSIHELFDVADAHRLMPPKSTWFEPKLRSGLFIHRI